MPEIRRDYVIESQWVVISPERNLRPSDFKVPKVEKNSMDKCPFCPGHEHMTPPEIMAYRKNGEKNGKGWWIRVIPNKYPALRIEGEVDYRENSILRSMNGVGAHEVIIETPDHDLKPYQLSDYQMHEVIHAYIDRFIDLTNDKRFKYILIFKNYGRDAGASLTHPHSQLIATPMIPRIISDEIYGAKNYYINSGGKCIYDEIITREKESGERVVFESDNFIVICPYASRFPFEMWILPKFHDSRFEKIALNDNLIWEFGRVLKDSLRRLFKAIPNVPFNYYIHTSPVNTKNEYRYYHWHLEITPRLSKPAGFEWGTGFYINPMPPEKAAEILREK